MGFTALCLTRMVSGIDEGQDGKKHHPDHEDESVEQQNAVGSKMRYPGGEFSQLIGYGKEASDDQNGQQ